MIRNVVLLLTCLFPAWGFLGCAAGAERPAAGPQQAAQAGPAPRPGAEPLPLRLLPPPAGVEPPAESCSLYASVTTPPCTLGRDGALLLLTDALQVTNEFDRDRALARVESCPAFVPGLIRALRAELAPAACADVLVNHYFAHNDRPLRADLKDLLFGLGIAARLERVVFKPPQDPAATQSKQQFQEFFEHTLAPWIGERAKAIHELLEQASPLQGYGRGVVAIAAGIADLRFVELTRALPLPKEMTEDVDLSDAYYGALDEALEPRKRRGRDAALVGLKEFGTVGILRSERLEQARRLLSSQYSGRRVDLLDALLLPSFPPGKSDEAQVKVLANLPTYYATDIFPELDVASPAVLRGLLDQGLSVRSQVQLRSTALSEEGRELHARMLFEIGRKYWRASHFAEAAKLAAFVPPGNQKRSELLRLLGALSVALEGGPQSAAEMMLKGPMLPGEPVNVAALDQLAAEKKVFAGIAAFNAALLLSLNPPTENAKVFWTDVEKRYRNAARLLSAPAEKKEALARADAAGATAKAANP